MGLYLTKILSFFNKRDVRMLMVGLDAAGKTTLLFKLKMGETVTTIPTIGFIVESVEYKNSKLTVWDVGGQTKIRALWRHYYQNTQGIIFVIDSNDHDRIGEARHELMQMLTEEELKDSALLIYANKQDLPKAMSTSQIVDSLGLSSLRSHPWHVQATCALTGEGLYQGLDWLVSEIEKKDQLQKK